MRRFLSAVLALLLLVLVPLTALCEYTLTPAGVPKETVLQKLTELKYLDPSLPAKDMEKALAEAILSFQKDQEIAINESQDLSARTLVRLFALTDRFPASVWVPVYGGQRYHGTESCSSMNEPESVSIQTALALGFTPCKRCKP